MFSRMIQKVDYYLLPVLITTPVNAFAGAYEEYIKYIKEPSYMNSLTKHTFSCVMGGFSGAIGGIFLGVVWPISVPLYIARTIQNKK